MKLFWVLVRAAIRLRVRYILLADRRRTIFLLTCFPLEYRLPFATLALFRLFAVILSAVGAFRGEGSACNFARSFGEDFYCLFGVFFSGETRHEVIRMADRKVFPFR
jgi:hypothetical protein